MHEHFFLSIFIFYTPSNSKHLSLSNTVLLTLMLKALTLIRNVISNLVELGMTFFIKIIVDYRSKWN